MSINVLFCTHSSAFKIPGGGEIQLLKTKEYIERLGVKVEMGKIVKNFQKYDLIHFFSLSKDIAQYVTKVKKSNLKIVVSPIYWPMLEYALKGDLRILQRFKIILKHFIDTRLSFFSHAKRILKLADIILPNSYTEAVTLREIFNVNKFSVVHNAADKRFSKAKPDEFIEKYGIENFILTVGRIEPRKNQLSLLKAVKNLDISVVLIGEVADLAFFKACKKYFTKKVIYIPTIPHDSSLLASAYAASKVFVLPSWYETPGLAALEAAMAGTNIVITNRGSTQEYFKNYALYVNPSDINDIRQKIEEAYFSKRNEKLKNFVIKNYTWERAAKETFLAYKKVLEQN